MKKTFTLTIYTFIVFVFFACSSAPSELILGKWNVADIKTTQKLTDAQKEVFKKSIEETKKDAFLEFKADKNFETNEGGKKFTGKWNISEDSKTLTLTYGKTNEVSRINELSGDKLSISITLNEIEHTIIYLKSN